MKQGLAIWIHLRYEATPVLAGFFEHVKNTETVGKGRFTYDPSYLERHDALALSPSIGLSDQAYETSANGGIFGFLLDAGPNAWGQQLLDASQPGLETYDYLRLAQGHRTGALSLSNSQDTLSVSPKTIQLSDLEVIQTAIKRFEQGLPIDPQKYALLAASSSVGGAKPKVVIEHDDKLWIAKFVSQKDPPQQPPLPVLEHAMLTLSKLCGLQTAASRLIEVQGEPVLLVERFDAEVIDNGDQRSIHKMRYASCRSALEETVSTYSGSYPLLARQMKLWSEKYRADQRELFKRMVFNIAISNTDDHHLNHGFIDTDEVMGSTQLRLSPNFDLTPIVPTTQRVYQAMDVGQEGPISTFDNALSALESFGLSDLEGLSSAKEVATLVRENWRESLKAVGVDQTGIETMRRCFERLEIP
ncbi:type II toxin-antitoxin system HipA family toxin [Orrella sp. 11846]|uniref:type II toxin-antitoxin system HipA family toxin n=1 Tax=Orrella sp. 11846 TaxID=3409913 RepID=UPI003B5B5A62